jgi:hypothetical protein
MRRAIAAAVVALLSVSQAQAANHYAALVGKYGFDVVSDQGVRSQLPKKDADALSAHIAVSGPSTLVDGRFLVAKGCAPHSCTVAEGLVVADTETGAVYGLYTDDGKRGVRETSRAAWDRAVGPSLPRGVREAVAAWKTNLS